MEYFGIALGTIACFVVWPLLKWWLDRVTENSDLPPPDGVDPEQWLKLVCPSRLDTNPKPRLLSMWLGGLKSWPNSAPVWLGILERFLSFTAFSLNQPVIVAGWLAFKVASKWQVWANLVQAPKGEDEMISNDNLGHLVARHRWGSYVLMRFLLGTLANVLVGAVIAYTVKRLFF